MEVWAVHSARAIRQLADGFIAAPGCRSRRPGGAMQSEVTLLTENEVQRSFRNLFKSKDVSPETFEKAEALLEELRAESPLRHRLSVELEEIKKLRSAKA